MNFKGRFRVNYPNIAKSIDESPRRSQIAKVLVGVLFPDDETYLGYTELELHYAFCAVQDTENWKNGIRTSIHNLSSKERDLIKAAVLFYTSSETTFTILQGGKGRVNIHAAGYYADIG